MSIYRPARFGRPTRFGQEAPSGGSDAATMAAGGPPAVDSTEESKGPAPLGVPRDYRVPSTITERPAQTADALERHAEAGLGQGAIVSRGPRYFVGDEWKVAGISPASVIEIQKAMVNAGLLIDFKLGDWDYRSANAYAHVLEFANAAGITDQMALQRMVEDPSVNLSGSGSGGGSGRQVVGFDENGDPIYSEYVAPPLPIRTTNKDDLKGLFRSLTSEKLGVGWTDAQLSELVDAYNWQEIRVQRDNYEQQVAAERAAFNQGPQAVAGQTITTEEAPSPETFAQQQLIARDPTGYQAAQVGLNATQMFEEALSKWGSR